MSISDPQLQSLQVWLQTAITTPWQTDRSELDHLIKAGSGNLQRHERLDIYTHAYRGRLVECMEAEYPVLQHALGAELFVQFAAEYLKVCPSTSYTLTELGQRFPQYLRDTRPADQTELWPEFMIELATLERLFAEVYHSQGTEETEVEPATETESILFETSARSMRTQFPVDEYFIAVRKHLKDETASKAPDFPLPDPGALLVFRRNYVVQLRRISPDLLPS